MNIDSTASFPQLRVRTEFSFRKVFGPVGKIAARLKRINAPAAGIVDAGTWGHTKWAKEVPVSMFGVEVPIPNEVGGKPIAWVLAREIRGFYRFSSALLQPEADPLVLLREYAPSLIRFAGAGLTDPDLIDYVDINPSSRPMQRAALDLAARINRPVVATSFADFPSPGDENAFLAMGGRESPARQYLLGEQELREELIAMSDDEWRKIRNATFEAANQSALILPKAPLIRYKGSLRELAAKGKKERLASGRLAKWTPAYTARLKRELDIIDKKDYSSYFLVVADLVRWAKTKMLVGPGRGSSSGSLLCFLIGITEVDPFDHGLLFERFIDLNRSDLPDIDIDFDDERRELAFEYLVERYGRENVARIGSVNTLKPRSAMFEACKRLAISDKDRFSVIDVLIEYSSGDSRYGHGLEDTFLNTGPGQKFVENNPAAVIVSEIEGHAWHSGVHAAGVIVSNEPIVEFCTVNAEGVAQIDKKAAEALNLLKIDALGLRTLGVLADAGIDAATLYGLKLDDPAVFEVFNDKRFCNIFQFEGASQRGVSARIRIDDFKTLDHITALARPGPLGGGASGHYIERAAGREEIKPAHPLVEEAVKDSFGVILYQEQVMTVVKTIGNFSWEDVSTIRRAMSASLGKEFFDQKGRQFVEGAATHGIDEKTAKELWDSICTFGAWSMNRAHTASYAMISYWCAWAKRYHPLAFAAASLRRSKSDAQTREILRELVDEGIAYVPFDAQISEEDWSVQGELIVGGFMTLHGVGPAKAKSLVERRTAGKLAAADYEKFKCKFSELYPLKAKYFAVYDKPSIEIASVGAISDCSSMPAEGATCIIGTVTKKRIRDMNESVLLARRRGKRIEGQALFLDFWIQDDGPNGVLCRIERWDYQEHGIRIFEASIIGETVLMLAGSRVPNIPMIKVEQYRIMNEREPEKKEEASDEVA